MSTTRFRFRTSLVFHLYKWLPTLHKNNTDINLFADDSTFHTSNKSIEVINDSLQKSLNITNEWCYINRMKIHSDKTKSMVITTSQTHKKYTFS